MQDYITYSDKEIQLAIMIAYMNVLDSDVKSNVTMQELMNTTRGKEIEEVFMKHYKDDTDAIISDHRVVAQQMFEDIRNGVSPFCAKQIRKYREERKWNLLKGN